tara:strand:+ start:353 stop:481 length:129 start_codon:yes stop_codon:yes gene_type:complete
MSKQLIERLAVIQKTLKAPKISLTALVNTSIEAVKIYLRGLN